MKHEQTGIKTKSYLQCILSKLLVRLQKNTLNFDQNFKALEIFVEILKYMTKINKKHGGHSLLMGLNVEIILYTVL